MRGPMGEDIRAPQFHNMWDLRQPGFAFPDPVPNTRAPGEVTAGRVRRPEGLEKVQLQDELENLRAADAPAEEGQKAGGAPPLPLPPLPKLELPKGLPKVELPKELPKLPKLPF